MMTKLIDCTIRDGGHLNNWNFSNECVKQSYIAASNAGADYFEIGYRCNYHNKKMGLFSVCEDMFLLSLFDNLNDRCKLSIMIDAGKCDADKFIQCRIDKTPISLIRVATYPSTLKIAFELCENLSELGYELFLNLMDFSEYKNQEYNLLQEWNKKTILKSICFADSFGSFLPNDVEKYYKDLKSMGYDNISFHSHNNLQMAFANSLKAIELGAYSIDASIYGMGRDAGNLPAELITGYLNNSGNLKYNPLPYMKVINKYYKKIQEEYPWGYKLQSLIGGLKNIHPHCIDELFNTESNTIDNIWQEAARLANNKT